MNNIIIVILTAMLSGCIYQTINSDEIVLATWYCKDKGGVKKMTEHFNGETYFQCKEPFSITYDSEVLQGKYLKSLKETDNE